MGRRTLLVGMSGAIAASGTPRAPGDRAAPLSARSRYEALGRSVDAIGQDAAAPLEQLDGIITPADLHFSRHHFGAPDLDPATYRLLVHGLVDRPLVLGLDDLRRFPSKSVICFIECAGNGAGAFHYPRPTLSPREVDGATSTSEWVGVPLAQVLEEARVTPAARWLLAESQDAGRYARSIPLSKAYNDALLAYAQNGEPLRVEQGFPVRLLLPGWEGSASVKWVGRVELIDGPAMTRDETARYSDVKPDGSMHAYSFVMPVKSIITSPSYPQFLAPGWHEIRGLAWSGAGRITRVEVTTDAGVTWSSAQLDEPVLPRAHTRFRLPWRWDQGNATLMSRALDETGASQPTLASFRESHPPGNDYRNNYIRVWRVDPDGRVTFAAGC